MHYGGIFMNLSSPIALVLSAVCSASMAIVMRLFNTSENNRYGIILGNYITCTLTGFLLIGDKSMILSSHPSTYICGIIGGFLFVLSLLCIQTSIGVSGAILTSAFSKLGLLVPLALSLLFFHEQPSFLQGIGILAVLASIYVMNRPGKTGNINLISLLIVLFTNGMSDSMAKIYNMYGNSTEEPVYMFFVFLTAAILTTYLLLRETEKTGKKTDMRDLSAGIAVGLPNYFSAIFLLAALHSIPAFIVYPVFSTGTILIVTAVSIPLFKEHLNAGQIAGLCLIMAALILLNI